MTPSLFLLFTCFLASCSCPPLFMFSFSSHLFFLASFLLPLLFWSCLFCLLCCMLFFINSSLWTTTDDILVTAYKRACVCVRVCVCVIRNACDQVSPRTAGLVCMKSSTSVVELVMLLCSQVSFFLFFRWTRLLSGQFLYEDECCSQISVRGLCGHWSALQHVSKRRIAGVIQYVCPPRQSWWGYGCKMASST